MEKFPLHKAFTFLEPGPVVLVTTAGENRPNVMTLSWTMVLDFTPRFAFMTGSWNFSYCRIIDHIKTHNIFVLDAVEAWIDEKCKEPRFFHAVGDGRFIVDGEKINHRKIMIDKLPAGV